MENYSFWIFIAKYAICIFLLFILIKKNKAETLTKSFIITFFGFTLVILANFLLSISKSIPITDSFYQINFIDFALAMLLINVVIKRGR